MDECAWLQSEHNLSLHGAARALSVPHSLLIKWKSTLPALKVVHDKSCCSIGKGYVDQFDPVKEEILAWIFARCEQGIAVTESQVMFKASSTLDSLGVKGFEAF